MLRKSIACALALLLLAGIAACASSSDDADTSPAETTEAPPEESVGVSAEEEPTSPGESSSLTEAEAYAQAAANGVEGDQPFSVYRPTWLPEGFVFQSANVEISVGHDLSVVYTSADGASISVDVAVGDVGDAAPVARMAWGTYGECSVFEDAWDDSYIALAPSSGSSTPNVRTVGVALEDLERVLAGMEVVEP